MNNKLLKNSYKKQACQLVVSVVVLMLFFVLSSSVYALSENRLWLSKKNSYLMPGLISAARQVESTEECTEVVDGQLDNGRSTPEIPVFRFICRNPQGLTYVVRSTGEKVPVQSSSAAQSTRMEPNAAKYDRKVRQTTEITKTTESTEETLDELAHSIMADNEDLTQLEEMPASSVDRFYGLEPVDKEEGEATNGSVDIDSELADKPEPALPATEKVAVIDAEKGWAICKQGIEDKTVNMLNKQLYDIPRPEPEVTANGESIYVMDFDAFNPVGLRLRYRASCKVLAGGVYLVTISPRKSVRHNNALEGSGVKSEAADIAVDSNQRDTIKSEEALPKNTNTSIAEDVSVPDTQLENNDASRQATEDGWTVIEEN